MRHCHLVQTIMAIFLFTGLVLPFHLSMAASGQKSSAVNNSGKGSDAAERRNSADVGESKTGSEKGGSENERMDIFGDVMYLNEDGTRVVEGHLVIQQEDMTLWADRGTYNDKDRFATATGNVKVQMEDSVLTCGYLEYFMDRGKSVARIRPKIVRKFSEVVKEPSDKSETDKKASDEKASENTADGNEVSDGGNVSGDEKKGDSSLSARSATVSGGRTAKPRMKTGIMVGREIEIYHDESRVKAIGNAMLTQFTEGVRKASSRGRVDMAGDVKITAETIELFTDVNRLIALRNVKIVNNDMTATGNKAIYDDNSSVLDIYGNARTWQSSGLAGSASDKGVEKPEGGPSETVKVQGASMEAELVHINNMEGGHAEAERAVYDSREEVLDLIGSAKSWEEDGINLAQGDRIRYFLKDKRSVIIDARIKHYAGGDQGTPAAGKTKKPAAKKARAPRSAEEAALEALRELD